MANTPIQVLALNDDNHDTCFVTRGSYFHDAADFMKECLLKPHNCEYKVGYVALVDMTGDEDEDMMIFDRVACEYNPETLFTRDQEAWQKREEAFDYLWSVAEKEYFYV